MGDSGTTEIKRGVRLVKKHVKKDKKVEKTEKKVIEQNGNAEPEAELTVTLPSKKSDSKTNLKPDAKTETEVDVVKKILADGSVEETKTTTIKTTVGGVTETETKTDTRTLPKEEADIAKEQAKKQQELEQNKVKNNNNHNEDTSQSAELVVKLPVKKSGATTETKVEIENKILSDGTVEETKTTTTKTTIDGESEITTKVDKRILSKEEADAAVEVEEEEIEEEEEEEINEENLHESNKVTNNNKIITNDESSEVTTIKKTVVSSDLSDHEQESEEENDEEAEKVEQKKDDSQTKLKSEDVIDEEADEEEEEEIENEEEEVVQESKPSNKTIQPEVEETVIEEEEIEEDEEEQSKEKIVKKPTTETNEELSDQENDHEQKESKEKEMSDDEEEEDIEEVNDEEEEHVEESKPQTRIEEEKKDENLKVSNDELESNKRESERSIPIEKPSEVDAHKSKNENSEPFKEPSVPLEKVEDIEIKPIGLSNETVTKSQIEKTEIVMSTEKPAGPLSTQTEFNRYENIIKVNRTTKTLDNAYEQLTQNNIPPVKTYFAPNREKVSSTYPPQAHDRYQPTYTSDNTTERRHSLLLERLSAERQLPPADIYQNNYQHNTNQLTEQLSWSQEPQSEVLNVSNVKPSTITNQQWYQQTKKENTTYNNVSSNVPTTPSQDWKQPQHQPQSEYKPQPQYQAHPQNQTQPQFQPQHQYQPQSQYQLELQRQPYIQPQQKQNFVENTTSNYTRTNSNTYQKNNLSSFISNNWTSGNIENVESTANKFSTLRKESANDIQNTPLQYTTGYVPPPWEQDSTYVADNNINQNYYPSTLPTSNTYNSSPNTWLPQTTNSKFSKPPPKSYIPPAPNQSFVKAANAAVEPPKLPGRKTYYSEYERRYITVPESTYIPGETKLSPQPDPSPKYYYDNNEPTETVEHQWRKELREFTEKTSQTQIETGQVKPPWEEDQKYVKSSSSPYTSTPSWSQTLRPRSWRERSFESDYVGSQEWPKTNTLGRSRPVSSYVQNKVDPSVVEKPRGVSVDRYNPNSYQSPIAEHPPVQSHTLTPTTAPHTKTYHNPNVPAYHARASVEPREQPASYQQPRLWGESRDSPIQSRSFKYLQWITGTEN